MAGKVDYVVKMIVGAKYGRIHQYGGVINHPGTSDGFGRGIKIPPHKINMPKRLWIEEDFEKSGRNLILKSIATSITRQRSKIKAKIK